MKINLVADSSGVLIDPVYRAGIFSLEQFEQRHNSCLYQKYKYFAVLISFYLFI